MTSQTGKKAKTPATIKDETATKTTKSKASTPDNLSPASFEPYMLSKNEEYMSEKQLTHFKKILDNWKRELMREVDNTIKEMKEDKEAGVSADPNDRATQEEIFSLELRTRDRERKLIKKIEEAISDIEEGEYGYCESCGVEIGIKRLEARPTATLCIDCKTLAEIREKRV
jgi:DnaK suppressor protein